MLYEDFDLEGQIEFNEEDLEVEEEEEDEEEEDENGEHVDRVGLLVPSPRVSLVGGSGRASSFSSANNKARSRTHSLHSGLGFVTGLRTRAGGRVRVGRVRVRVERKSPAPNPYLCPGFGGFGFDVTTRVLPSSPRQNGSG